MSAQVNMHQEHPFTYPFELPTEPSGFQTKLELIDNSGSVDEIRATRSGFLGGYCVDALTGKD